MATLSKRFNAKNGISVGTKPTDVIDVDGNVTTGELTLVGNAPYSTKLIASDVLTGTITLTLPSTVGTSGQVLKADGTGKLYWGTSSSGLLTLNDLTDVTITAPVAGNTLTFNGTEWSNNTGTFIKSSIVIPTTVTDIIDTININDNKTAKWQVVVSCPADSLIQTFDLHALLPDTAILPKWTKVAILGDKINITININIAGSTANLTFTNNELSDIHVEFIRLST